MRVDNKRLLYYNVSYRDVYGVFIMREDLTGKVFGLLTVICSAPDEITKRGSHIAKWKCRCVCGREIVTRGSSLKSGHTKGCGQKHRSFNDLSGQRFGKLTVLRRVENNVCSDGTTYVMYKCKCDCGNEIVTRATSLKNGHTRSCGCAHHDGAMGIGLEDLTGRVFGYWTVLYENGRLVEPRGRLVPLWHCRCKCGEERDIRGGTLKSGSSLSCGCLKSETLRALAENGVGTSHGELLVKRYLDALGVYYEPQRIFPDLRSASGYHLIYDFLVYKNGLPYLLIEYQGLQHYQPVDFFGGKKQFIIQTKNDNLKRKYALKSNLHLVEIPYTCDTYESIVCLLDVYFS